MKDAKTNRPIKPEKGPCAILIRKQRRTLDLTQEKLGELLGIDASAIRKYESGRVIPPADKLAKLAELFDITTDYLLGRSDIPRATDNIAATIDQIHLDGLQQGTVGAFKQAYARTEGDLGKLRQLKHHLEQFIPMP